MKVTSPLSAAALNALPMAFICFAAWLNLHSPAGRLHNPWIYWMQRPLALASAIFGSCLALLPPPPCLPPLSLPPLPLPPPFGPFWPDSLADRSFRAAASLAGV